jgi:hypothetical protein
VVEAKKDRCANDGAPKSPEDSADAPPPPPARIFAWNWGEIKEIAPILPQ